MSFFHFSISHAASQINDRNTLMIHQCHFCLAAQKVKWKRKKKKSKYLLNYYLRTVDWISQWLSVLSVPWSLRGLVYLSDVNFFSIFLQTKQIDNLQPCNLPPSLPHLTASALAPEPCSTAFRQGSWVGCSIQCWECCFPQLPPLDDGPILAP